MGEGVTAEVRPIVLDGEADGEAGEGVTEIEGESDGVRESEEPGEGVTEFVLTAVPVPVGLGATAGVTVELRDAAAISGITAVTL